jgi:dienelactone hydrolase
MSLFLTLLLSAFVPAQDKADDARVLKSEDQPNKMLYTYLVGEARKHFDARRKEIASLKTPADVARRQNRLRESFVEALGGFPEKTPLNAKVTGKGDRDGYRFEKVIYESRPDHHVTAILYLPEGRGPFPGVLFPCGHSDEGKGYPEYQRACILLAKNGIAVLCFDPISQGERVQLLKPDGKPAIGRGTTEHTMAGVSALLVGQCTASYEIWDGIRSIDYLASRPEVDPARLGCLGNSGGGTQTSYLMALDDRIACAVPNCYITSLERLFETIGPQDAEQNIPGQVAFGLEHADYLFLRAPRPTQINAATRDFFDIQGSWTTFREAKQIYGLLGFGERVDLSEINDTHAISRPMRQAALRWFRRWLAGVDDAPVETDFQIAKDSDLWCTSSGNAVSELHGKTVFDLIADRERELAGNRGRLAKEVLLKEVARLIGVDYPVDSRRLVSSASSPGADSHKVARQTAPGIRIPEREHLRAAAAKSQVLYVHGEIRPPDVPPASSLEALLGDADVATVVDLRGWGETSPGSGRGNWVKPFGADWDEAFLGLHLGRPLLGQRVLDLLKVQAARGGKRIVGSGAAAPVVLHAAALDPEFPPVVLEGMVISWSAVARSGVSQNQLTNVVHGALKVYDLPDLAAAMAPRPLIIRNPVDPSGKSVSQAELEAAYAKAREAYRAAGGEQNLLLQAAP